MSTESDGPKVQYLGVCEQGNVRGMKVMTKLRNAMVFIVDDDPWIRRALERLLLTHGLESETFDSGVPFLAQPLPSKPCCLIVDLAMPEIGGLEVLEAVAKKARRIPAIFITGQGDIPSSVAAMKGGALDFLEKPFEDDDLLTAVDRALEIDRRRLAEQQQRAESESRLAALTPRERQILPHVVEGLANKVIAVRLGISEKTVKVHRARVMSKMAADSLPDLVRIASSLGIRGLDRATEPTVASSPLENVAP